MPMPTIRPIISEAILHQIGAALGNNFRALANGGKPADLVQAKHVEEMLARYLPPTAEKPAVDMVATNRALEVFFSRGITYLFGSADHFLANS